MGGLLTFVESKNLFKVLTHFFFYPDRHKERSADEMDIRYAVPSSPSRSCQVGVSLLLYIR